MTADSQKILAGPVGQAGIFDEKNNTIKHLQYTPRGI